MYGYTCSLFVCWWLHQQAVAESGDKEGDGEKEREQRKDEIGIPHIVMDASEIDPEMANKIMETEIMPSAEEVWTEQIAETLHNRQMQSDRHRQIDRHTQTDRQTYMMVHWWAQTDRQIQADRHRQIDRQIQADRCRQIDRHTQTNRQTYTDWWTQADR